MIPNAPSSVKKTAMGSYLKSRQKRVVLRCRRNGQGMGHGGFIFNLADSAFAYSCNSHNHNAVASGCTIEFLKSPLPP